MLNKALTDYYRCPEDFGSFTVAGDLSTESGYFHFGPDVTCFGRRTTRDGAGLAIDPSYDALEHSTTDASVPGFPFNPLEVIDNLRCERYAMCASHSQKTFSASAAVRRAYYFARPLMPVSIRKHLQKYDLKDWDVIPFPKWPLDRSVDRMLERLLKLSLQAQGVSQIPFIWFWPEGHSSCATMTHDVEEPAGLEFCRQLMDIDDAAGIKASFQIVPEKRYAVSAGILNDIRARGFEVNVHDLNHDGHLYADREEFFRRARRINTYLREFGASGFRSGALYRNIEWYDALDCSYDMSVPNVAHLDPQKGGCCTVMPYFIGKILELPVTTTQDYTLFNILQDYEITLWVRQLEMIRLKHGLASFIIHPDYVIEERAQNVYRALLNHLSKLRAEENMWIALPGEVDRWWRERAGMKLVAQGDTWAIEGPGKDRARLAYAVLKGDDVCYSFPEKIAEAPTV